LLSHDYILSTVDHSLFLKHHCTNTTTLLVYVDDIVLTGNDVVDFLHYKYVGPTFQNKKSWRSHLLLGLHATPLVFILVKENIL